MHVAPAHLSEGVGSQSAEGDCSCVDCVGRREVEFREAGLDVKGMDAVEEVGRDDIGRNDDSQGSSIVVSRKDDAVIEVVISEGFDEVQIVELYSLV